MDFIAPGTNDGQFFDHTGSFSTPPAIVSSRDVGPYGGVSKVTGSTKLAADAVDFIAPGTNDGQFFDHTGNFSVPSGTFLPSADGIAIANANGTYNSRAINPNQQTTITDQVTAIVCVKTDGNVAYTQSFPGNAANILAGDGTWIPVGSSLRFKEEVVSFTKAEADKVIDEVCERPVSFTYKENKARHFGLIAEDVAQLPLTKQIVNYDKEGLPVSLRLEDLTVPIAMCVKELKDEVVRLKKRVREIEEQKSVAVPRLE